MANQTKQQLYDKWITNYIPTQTDFRDLFDTIFSPTEIEDILWADLVALKGSFTPEQHYRITDFKTTYYMRQVYPPLLNTSATVEPLIVRARTADELYLQAYSPTYPTDIIHYELEEQTFLSGETIVSTGGQFGRIVYRECTVQDIATHQDWRSILSRRWESTPASGQFYVGNLDDWSDTLYDGGTVGQTIMFEQEAYYWNGTSWDLLAYQDYYMIDPSRIVVNDAIPDRGVIGEALHIYIDKNNPGMLDTIVFRNSAFKFMCGPGMDVLTFMNSVTNVTVRQCSSVTVLGDIDNFQFEQGTAFFGGNVSGVFAGGDVADTTFTGNLTGCIIMPGLGSDGAITITGDRTNEIIGILPSIDKSTNPSPDEGKAIVVDANGNYVLDTLAGGDGGVQTIVAGGVNITVDSTDPDNPIISFSTASGLDIASVNANGNYLEVGNGHVAIDSTGQLRFAVNRGSYPTGTRDLYFGDFSDPTNNIGGFSRPGAYIMKINTDTDVCDFVQTPTVNGVPVGGGGGIADAPNDGKIYVRRNAAWEELVIS